MNKPEPYDLNQLSQEERNQLVMGLNALARSCEPNHTIDVAASLHPLAMKVLSPCLDKKDGDTDA